MTEKGPLIFYELNEVPWRVVDFYVKARPNSCFARILPVTAQFTTVTKDEGQLHPWSTWPSLHRGVYNTTHKLLFLNQDRSCAASFPPIWEELASLGIPVGVFGSLQSYPPSSLPFEFFVPDTFAPAPTTVPRRYECFQRFNLRRTREDGAVAEAVSLDGSSLNDVVQMFNNGLTVRTFGRLCHQILWERVQPLIRSRRSIFQAPVAFDVFRHALTNSSPRFCDIFYKPCGWNDASLLEVCISGGLSLHP